MTKPGGIHDSGKYRQPTQAEAAELKRLMKVLDLAWAADDQVAERRATDTLQRLLKTMEIKK